MECESKWLVRNHGFQTKPIRNNDADNFYFPKDSNMSQGYILQLKDVLKYVYYRIYE